jgi:hypothetical protein
MRRIIATILGVLIFIGILLIVMALQGLKNKPSNQNEEGIFPTITSTQQGGQKDNNSSLHYDKKGVEKLLLDATTRPTPSQSDTQLRQQLIQELNEKSGTLLQTPDFNLEYVKAPNDFEVEIKTTNVSQAKLDAISYFKDKGFSNDGICKLPLMFYLNSTVAQSYRQTNQTFNPIPDFCK